MAAVLFLLVAIVACSNAITPFKIDVPDSVLDDLKTRLSRSRIPEIITRNSTTWGAGADAPFMRVFSAAKNFFNFFQELVEYWKTSFDWRATERKLNEMPQFTTQIDDFTIHFVHAKSKYPNAQPLVFLHGWPGSFWECHKILPMLTDPLAYGGTEDDAFHVVCPSIPGYGFSSAPQEPGHDQLETAKLNIQLMKKLGYEKYWVQGGDWGALIGASMAYLDPNVIGFHTNMGLSNFQFQRGIGPLLKSLLVFTFPSWMVPKEEIPFLERQKDILFTLKETGYFHLQTTKPNTIGIALNDSPVGLASYITEKFEGWIDGDIEKVFTKDELLTNIMIYWVSGTISSSVRYYYEFFNGKNSMLEFLGTFYVSAPTAIANFPKELPGTGVRVLAEMAFNVQHWTMMKAGGHFAALEQPKALVEDVRSFRRTLKQKKTQPDL